MMIETLPHNTALLLVDVQQGSALPEYYGERNNPRAEHNVARLLAAWRAAGRPVFHIQHHSTTPGSPLSPSAPGVAFKPEAEPQADEPIITKNVNSAFIGTGLDERLRQAGIKTLVICGLTTEHCVSTTTRMAGNMGYTVYVAADATAANSKTTYDGQHIPAAQVFAAALANLHGEFATVLPTDELLGGEQT